MRLTLDELKKYLEEDYFFSVDNGEFSARICRGYSVVLELENAVFEERRNGYEITLLKGEGFAFHKIYKRFSAFAQKLEACGFLKDGIVTVGLINDRFSTFEEAEESRLFDELDMKGILEKYKRCDTFSLSRYLGDVYLSAVERDEIFSVLQKENRARLKELYERYKTEINAPFEKLIDEIAIECQRYGDGVDKRKFKYGYQYSFICDVVGEKTNYDEPREFFWQAYHTLGMEIDCKRDLLKHEKMPQADITAEVKKEPALFQNFIRYEIKHSNHCTVSGAPIVTYYFKLNADTRAWLLQFPTDYDLAPLEDLALYEGEKLRFSSCTHEGFHTDYSKDN